jgi:hypothetical protein
VLGDRENSDSVNNEDPADGSTSLENNNIPRVRVTKKKEKKQIVCFWDFFFFFFFNVVFFL